MDVNKCAESLQILNEYAQSLLGALAHSKRRVFGDTQYSATIQSATPESDDRIKLFADPTYAPITKSLMKKFPDSSELPKASILIVVTMRM